jgi:hypothetical protein
MSLFIGIESRKEKREKRKSPHPAGAPLGNKDRCPSALSQRERGK